MNQEKTYLQQDKLCFCGSAKDAQICCSYEIIFNNIKSLVTSNNLIIKNLLEAETLCKKLLNLNSSDLRIYQALFFIYSKTNNPKQALISLEEISTLTHNPIRLAQCYSDTGNMLNNLGEKKEAEEALKKAIELNPDYAPAHYNLAVVYMSEKKNDEAIEHYKLAIKLDPSFTKAYNNLTRLLINNPENLQESLYYLQKAIELSPDMEELIYNLGITFSVAGNFLESKLAFEKSFTLMPTKWESFEKSLDCMFLMSEYEELVMRIKKFFENKNNIPVVTKKRMYFYLYLLSFLQEDYSNCDLYLCKSSLLLDFPDEDKKIRAIKIFYNYIKLLVLYRNANYMVYEKSYDDNIYIIGESHCLSSAHLIINLNDKQYKIVPYIITGCKIWHLISPYQNSYSKSFDILLNKATPNSITIMCFGEIDCRFNEGIMSFYRKNPEIDIELHIHQMILKYISLLRKKALEKQLDILVQGVPAPNVDLSNIDQKEKNSFLDIVKYFNHQLKNECNKYDIKFLDVYSLTANEFGTSNGLYHLDGHHLKPHYINLVM